MEAKPDQLAKATTFQKLHEAGCFVMPNPWDVGTAMYLQRVGFKALATTSAGFAFSQGLPDEVTAIPRDMMLEHVREMANGSPLPMNADFQNGYADEPEGVAESVRLCVGAGVSGLSVEDATGGGDSPLYDRSLAIERIKAARHAIDATGVPVVLTARCEAWLVGEAEAAKVVLDRLVAFADAGADCLFAPGVKDVREITEIVKAVAPKPVNVIMSAPHPELSVQRLEDLGVRRISVGSALSRVAWGAFMRTAQGIFDTGTFDGLGDAASFAELNSVFSG